MLISRDHRVYDIVPNKISYFMAPKCGSRTVFGYGYLFRDPRMIETQPDWFSEDRLRYVFLYRAQREWRIRGKELSHPIKFCVVRDPIERVISAFSNRVNTLGKAPLGLNLDRYIQEKDFEENEEVLGDISNHLVSQVDRYGDNPKIFTHIFNMKQFGDLKKLIEQVGKVSLPLIHLHKSKPEAKPTLTADQISWVKETYKKDYEVYGKWM